MGLAAAADPALDDPAPGMALHRRRPGGFHARRRAGPAPGAGTPPRRGPRSSSAGGGLLGRARPAPGYRVVADSASWVDAATWSWPPARPGARTCRPPPHELHPDVDLLPALRYRNPGQLKPGGVLVVGASASGVQIADELGSQAGRRVVLVGDLDAGRGRADDEDSARLQLAGVAVASAPAAGRRPGAARGRWPARAGARSGRWPRPRCAPPQAERSPRPRGSRCRPHATLKVPARARAGAPDVAGRLVPGVRTSSPLGHDPSWPRPV